MASNGFQSSYANERPGAPSSTGSGEGAAEVAADPASSSFFLSDYKKRPLVDAAYDCTDPASNRLFDNDSVKHDDLKQMLDSNKDSLKLEAMKRIIGMVAKGKDASDLFPAVVKNVVSKNIEVKKLVYVYLTRYAEEQQDLALLSISTFQRALKDPNQLIRASALRVLSSIRVSMIVPIMMLAIKEAVMDMSPYVRKTAAHAIPKLYSMDPEQKDILIEVIEKLLADKTTLVAGSAIQAFEEVCPERNDLIHKNYRKLCNLLVDVEEWGQVVIINMLTRYARTQFVNPNEEGMTEENEKAFYESDESEDVSASEANGSPRRVYVMDSDHRLLLRASKPLLNSRNSAVVMAVAQLYHHCAPKSEVSLVAKALIRLLRSHKEVQYMVLSNIASMSILRKGMFEPFLKSFYVRSSDPTHVKLLKLEILTNLATESNISTILREFQTYVTSSDEEFAAATIQAIGRCASSIAEITDTCLNGLVNLLSNRNEAVVGESVVVIKKLLQTEPTEHKEIIQHLAKLAENISVPMARASILWLIGEYSDRVPKIAPDVLRKMAKTFIDEEDIVKLQILNLAAKLCITNPKQTKLLCQYVFSLAKYDQNYDIRDRVRFLRQLILPSGDKGSGLSKHAKKIFLATKPAPVLESKFKDRDQYQLGTLSHVINARAQGYQELPEWPTEAPDPSVRNVEVQMPWVDSKTKTKKQEKKKSFYSSESSSEEDSETGSESGSEEESQSESSGSGTTTSGSDSESETESDDESESESESEEERPPVKKAPVKKVTPKNPKMDTESSEGTASGSESGSEDSSDDSSEDEPPPPPPVSKKSHKHKEEKKKKSEEKSSVMLLDLDDFGPSVNPMPTMSPGGLLTPSTASNQPSPSSARANYSVLSPVYTPTKVYEVHNKVSGSGVSCSYKFTRTVSVFSPKMVSIELTFTNHKDGPIASISMGKATLAPGMTLQEFPEITNLGSNASTTVILAVDFNDTTQPAKFTLKTPESTLAITISAPVGELLTPNTLTEGDFLKLQKRLAGMNENSSSMELSEKTDSQDVCNAVYSVANVAQIGCSQADLLRFVGRTISSGSDTLVTVAMGTKTKITVNCDKMVIGSMLLKDIKSALGAL